MSTTRMVLGLLGVGLCGLGAEEPTLESLRRGHEQEMEAVMERVRAAETIDEKRRILSEGPEVAETIEAMVPLLVREQDREKQLEALEWIFRYSQDLPIPVREVVMQHKESKDFARIILAGWHHNTRWMRELRQVGRLDSEHPEVRGVAAFLNARDYMLGEEKKLQEVRYAVANLGDYEIRGGRLRDAAARLQFELEHLAIGEVAPEIVGEDQDGVLFRLSDYRGKVVVLDFWGDW